MLAPEEFKTLTLLEQVHILRSHGRYVHYRLQGWCKIELYYFHQFYVEIWYLHNDEMVGLIRVLSGRPNLEPYLSTIRLKEV